MLKDHSDSERGNPLPPHRLLFTISSKSSFIDFLSHRLDNTYHNLCYTSRGALARSKNSSMDDIRIMVERKLTTIYPMKWIKTTDFVFSKQQQNK